jgi:capsular polysaccharide biosynthesis protein
MLKERQEEINIQTAMKSSNIIIVDAAVVNEEPIRPNLQLNMAISFVLALFVSIFIIFLIEFMDDTIKEEKDIEKAINVNVIGIIPDIKDIEDHK